MKVVGGEVVEMVMLGSTDVHPSPKAEEEAEEEYDWLKKLIDTHYYAIANKGTCTARQDRQGREGRGMWRTGRAAG